jgi:hypothetical protein
VARKELVDAYVGGRITQKDFVARLVALGVTVAAAVAFAVSLAGPGAPAASAAPFVLPETYCATGNFYPTGGELDPLVVTILTCPEYQAAPGAAEFTWVPSIPGARVEMNLDFADLEGTEWWRPVGSGIRFNGLAPGEHVLRVRAVHGTGEATVVGETTYYWWYVPGPVPENVQVAFSGPANSKALITWSSAIPAWRYYCSVNGSEPRVCRVPAGLSLNGLPAGQNEIRIRAFAGPADGGREAVILFDRENPAETLSVYTESAWGLFAQS